ncbi:alpha/beta hydrolase [Nitriliruptor alkaliphilus]|uniref:alpha/beta hydrolase n=1 Tax=Nitriliruptor alkaliphilus TaxID=427918 RepID=UPI001B803267|nr:alpha/beta fold hydrolase [Nitriliruptor alkaliphilus]
MTHASPHLTAMAGGAEEVDRLLDDIEDVWLDDAGVPLHLDLHRAALPCAVVVFQPGSGSHARFYFQVAGLLARHGYHVLVIDRPGHGLSGGPRGDCTIEEAIEVADTVIAYARSRWSLPVVLMGSSLGGLLAVFGLLRGSTPDFAVASLFGFTAKAPATAPPTLVLNGERDAAIPAWATRLFTRWSGLASTQVTVVPDAGHLLFHDHLDTTLPIVTTWLDARLCSTVPPP